MRRLDKQYTATPFYGSRRMQVALQQAGHPVNRKHVQRLMRLMGLEAMGPRPRLSEPHPGHRVYPYLLRNVPIVRIDQVWSTDITYVRLRDGFVYLVAILDWYSRYVLAWDLSVTVDGQFCLDALETALPRARRDLQYRRRLAIHRDGLHRSDQGGGGADQHGRPRPCPRQRVCRTALALREIRRVYLKDYGSVSDARVQLARYFHFYNQERPHQSLAYRTPAAVYAEAKAA